MSNVSHHAPTMFSLSLLKRKPPAVTAWLFYYGLPVDLIIRFLLGSMLGILLLSILLYWLMWVTGEPKPLTFAQLALWVDALPTESKTAVVTSVLTILGFLIAFHTATVNWKAEALAHLKERVAGEIELFFTEASGLITDTEIYADSLVKTIDLIQRVGKTPDAAFRVQRVLETTSKFLADRDRLSAMSIEVHRIAGRHYSVLSTVWGATKALEECASSFAEITQCMWIRVPNIQANFPDPIGQFLSQVNVTECRTFTSSCQQNFGFINGTTGGVRGLLLAPLVGVNLATRFSLSGKHSVFVEAMEKVRGASRDGG